MKNAFERGELKSGESSRDAARRLATLALGLPVYIRGGASRKAANEATKRVEAFEAIGRRERERERDGARSAEKRFGKASSFGGGKSVTWDDDVSITPSTTTSSSVVDARAGAQTPEAAARPHNTVFKPPVGGVKSFQ